MRKCVHGIFLRTKLHKTRTEKAYILHNEQKGHGHFLFFKENENGISLLCNSSSRTSGRPSHPYVFHPVCRAVATSGQAGTSAVALSGLRPGPDSPLPFTSCVTLGMLLNVSESGSSFEASGTVPTSQGGCEVQRRAHGPFESRQRTVSRGGWHDGLQPGRSSGQHVLEV